MKKLYVVGIGPGNGDNMSCAAVKAINESEVIVGYTKYIQLVAPLFPEKKAIDTPMRQEIDRCRKALELAESGMTVAMICSGDAGVYGMAGPVYELSPEYPDVEIRVIPGITAALSGAAVLGAPLTHDFAVISLSDLMTPWDKIEKRLACAGEGDFCVAIYNPSSRKRSGYLRRACDVLLKYKKRDTVCGVVRNIGRDGEGSQVCTLLELRDMEVDMFTTVFVGNASTKNINGHMVTPRGYRID